MQFSCAQKVATDKPNRLIKAFHTYLRLPLRRACFSKLAWLCLLWVLLRTAGLLLNSRIYAVGMTQKQRERSLPPSTHPFDLNEHESSCPPGNSVHWLRVQEGDTCESIASKYEVATIKLMKINFKNGGCDLILGSTM